MHRSSRWLLFAASVAVASAARAGPSIYRCEINGVVTFADRPCGAEATTYSPDTTRVSTYEAPPSRSISATKAAPKKRLVRTSIAEAQSKAAEECRRIDAALRDIRSKQRAGYGAKEGERMKERQRALSERRRTKRCR